MPDEGLGYIKRFNNTQNNTFINPQDGQITLQHYRVIQGENFRSFNRAQVVKFRIQQSGKGLQAAEVTVETVLST